jgi:tRNA (cmo5U34)-methyltransferase
MSHSVSQHLRIQVGAYDRTIRRFIPGYDEMLDRAVAAVANRSPLTTVIELGAGTGSLSARLLERVDDVSVELWDVDEAMLDQARVRLAPHGERARFVVRSFADPLPPCDAAMASLALHHLRTAEAKTACYASIAAGLAPGGVLVNADATISATPEAAQATYRQWADHLVASGIEEPDAWQHFEDWALEDRYFSIEEELGFLRDAGLVPRVDWQFGPSTVIVATRPA